jgi:hypothetical protein
MVNVMFCKFFSLNISWRISIELRNAFLRELKDDGAADDLDDDDSSSVKSRSSIVGPEPILFRE